MEDLPEKLRRNVVALSLLVILTWFLDLEISTNLPFISNVQHIDKTKLWLCVSLIMIYVFLRYRFDTKTNTEWESALSEFNSIRYKKLCALLCTELRKYLLYKKKPLSLINPDDYSYQNPEFDGLKIRDISLKAEARRDDQDISSGSAHFSHTITWSDGRWSSQAGGNGISYKESSYAKLTLSIKSTLQMLRYSKSGVDVIYPVILWYFAFLISLNQLIINWLAN